MSYADKVFIDMCRMCERDKYGGRESPSGMGGRNSGIYREKIRRGEPL